MKRIVAWMAMVAAMAGPTAALTTNAVGRDGITWTFARPRPVGQYVNGDWWVVGPVTIQGISPAPEDGRHGTMINPEVGIKQGFDKDFNPDHNPYDPALNVGTHPYTAKDIGMAEWGIRHTGTPELDNNWIPASYRDINGACLTAPTMAARVMGLRKAIDWEPLFQYAERQLGHEQGPDFKGEWAANPTPAFHKQVYNTYRDATLSGCRQSANPYP